MKYTRKAICFVLILLLTPICALAWNDTYDYAVRLEDPTEDDKLYACAMRFFEDNEDIIRTAASKMFESGMEDIDIRYYRSEEIAKGEYSVREETWVYNEVGTQKTELFDEEYLALANCTSDFRIMGMRLCDNAVAVDFEDGHDSIDFLRTYRFGYYYLPENLDGNISPDEVLAKAMPKQWELRLEIEDEYQLVRLSEDFIYFKWHG